MMATTAPVLRSTVQRAYAATSHEAPICLLLTRVRSLWLSSRPAKSSKCGQGWNLRMPPPGGGSRTKT